MSVCVLATQIETDHFTSDEWWMAMEICSVEAWLSFVMAKRLPAGTGPDDCESRLYCRKLRVYELSFRIKNRGVRVMTLHSLYCAGISPVNQPLI